MSANGSAFPEQTSEVEGKGKGKAVEQPSHDMSMEDDEEDEEEESGAEEPQEEDDDDEEDMDEIDTNNIIGHYGQRATRKKDINWAEAEEKSKAAGDPMDEEDEDDDDDFEDPDADEDHEMKG